MTTRPYYNSFAEALAGTLDSSEGFSALSLNGSEAQGLPLLLPDGLYLRQLPLLPESAKSIRDTSLSLCYLNGGYSWDETIESLTLWMPKTKPSGVICGSGYDNKRVKGAVDLYFGLAKRGVYGFGSEWLVDLSAPVLSPEKSRVLPLNLPFRVHCEDNGRISHSGSGEHLRVYMAGGLGDVMMATAAMGAFAERHNIQKCFDVYGATNLEAFRHLPFVNSVNPSPHSQSSMIELLSVGYSDEPGLPNTRYSFAVLDIDDTPPEQRYMRYVVTEREQHGAEAILYERGWRGEKILTLQANGGWKCKYWKGLVELSQIARSEGWFVCWTGSSGRVQVEGYDTPDGQGSLVGALSLRQLAAVQSMSSAWVGHESGGTYLAVATECPSVMLCGAYDGEEMLAYLAGQKGPWRVIREDWLKKCGVERGMTCRGDQGFPFNDGSGSFCPHRMKKGSVHHNLIGVGADCLDAISADKVWAAVKEIARGHKDYSLAEAVPDSEDAGAAPQSPFAPATRNLPMADFSSASYKERFRI